LRKRRKRSEGGKIDKKEKKATRARSLKMIAHPPESSTCLSLSSTNGKKVRRPGPTNWSGTTHLRGPRIRACFGQPMGPGCLPPPIWVPSLKKNPIWVPKAITDVSQKKKKAISDSDSDSNRQRQHSSPSHFLPICPLMEQNKAELLFLHDM